MEEAKNTPHQTSERQSHVQTTETPSYLSPSRHGIQRDEKASASRGDRHAA